MFKNISQRWRQLSGQNNWHGLLNPLDADLQRYIIHYGAMAQATYDTFNSEELSVYAGSSRYARRDLFSRVGLVEGNPFKYNVVKYIYATSSIRVPDGFLLRSLSDKAWCKQSNWIGYICVATDEGKIALGRRDILVAWRGSIQAMEWVKDLDSPLVDASKILRRDGGSANVHQGVLSMYTSDDKKSTFNKTSARAQVLAEVKRQVERYKDEEISITVTGHSLGAALSTLNAADIVANGYNKPSDQPNKPCLVTAFKFGSPRVGDSNFSEIAMSLNNLHMLDIQNAPDIVPGFPPFPYTNTGVELHVDSRKSPFLKQPGDVIMWHSLEGAYLHAVSGMKRDIALVNKFSGALKDKYLVPDFWWIPGNKGMVQESDGSWVLHDHEKDDDDPEL